MAIIDIIGLGSLNIVVADADPSISGNDIDVAQGSLVLLNDGTASFFKTGTGVNDWSTSLLGKGTAGKIAKFTGTGVVGDSLISESGSVITFSGGFQNEGLFSSTGNTTTSATFAGVTSTNNISILVNNGIPAITIGPSYNYISQAIVSRSVTTASSGTHNLMSSLAIKPLTVSPNATTPASVTNGATVYIEDAIAGTATITNNYALWIDNGTTRLDGAVEFQGIPSASTLYGLFYNTSTFRVSYAATINSLGGLTASAQTFANDTNVTITSATSTHTLGWTGQLAVSRGGTGASTLTGVLIGNGTSAVTAVTGTASQLLRRNAGNTAYEFFTFTGMNNPMTTLGDIIYEDGTPAPARLAGNISTTKQYLSQTGTGTVSANPQWSAIAGADVTGAALTKTDDTNVTLTLGGTPTTALLRAASLTLGWTGQLSVARGGTGGSTAIAGFNALSPLTTLGDLLYHDGTNNVRLAGNTTSSKLYLSQTGTSTVSAAPSWSVISGSDVTGAALTKTDDTNVTLTLSGNASTALLRTATIALGWTGQLSITRGGTGASTATAAFDALAPTTTLGDLIYHNGTDNVRLAGQTTTAKQYLSQTGTGTVSAAPAWATISGADITGAALTKTDDTNVTLTLGGTPTTALLRAASLTLGWTGQLAVSRGGTGLSAIGTSLQVLRVNSAGTALEFATLTVTGITTLNTLTAATQTFATGTSGTDFNISSATSTHTFNIPTASATNRGALSSADWTTFNNKLSAFGSQTANFFYAAPNGAAGSPTFRAIVAADVPTLNQNTTGSAGSVTNSATFNNAGSGAASGTTYNGSAAVTVSWNTLGALPQTRTTTTASTATLTPDISTGDVFTITAQAVALSVANPTGTPYNGQKMIIRIKDNGTLRGITWSGTQYRASSDLTLPASTTASRTLYLGFIYNSTDTKWDLIAKLDNFA